jgi:hypothetical protein
MEEIQKFRAGDARKEIFVSAGEPDDLMRKNRSDNDDLVVVEDAPVDFTATFMENSPPDNSWISSAESRRCAAVRQDCSIRD